MSASTLFGAPLGFTAASLTEWIEALEGRWSDFAEGARPGDLHRDLAMLRSVFGHGAAGNRLRTTFGKLTEATATLELPSEVVLTSDELELITPEGRILLDVLYRLRSQEDYVIDVETRVRSLGLAVETRASWYEMWASKQLAGSLSLSPIAAALLVLINGSIAPADGFYLPDEDVVSPDYEATVLELIGNFSEALGGTRPTSGALRNHWVFTQATRVLSRDLHRLPTQQGARVQVREGREIHLLADIQHRLARYPRSNLQSALLQLVDQYGRYRGLFASVGGSHERSSHTRWIVDSLMKTETA
ncbi:hypothetical protein [Modestobacter sp. SSW1-42]|uniref:hypothetical protein n=1 Tax=Modestobacter sp. SSW1-42 TaxID=596372 RepID=UPI0039874F15